MAKKKSKDFLGKQCRDKVSGFEGLCTAKYEYLNGCIRLELTGKVAGDKKDIPAFVFDIGQVELVEAEAPKVSKKRTGGSQSNTPAPR